MARLSIYLPDDLAARLDRYIELGLPGIGNCGSRSAFIARSVEVTLSTLDCVLYEDFNPSSANVTLGFALEAVETVRDHLQTQAGVGDGANPAQLTINDE